MTHREAQPVTRNTPIYSLLGLVTFVVAMVVVYLTGHADDAGVLLALAASTIPSLVASLSAERASRDIRNGVVSDKVHEATTRALIDAEVVTRTGPVATESVKALASQTAALEVILTDLHSLAARNAAQLQTVADAVVTHD